MTNTEYIELISREPLPNMVTEMRDKEGVLLYKYIKKTILQKELMVIFDGHTKWNMEREVVTKQDMYGKGVLSVRHPVSFEWLEYSGSASLPNNKPFRLNYPSLDAHCLMNACKKIGVWFGQTLNSEIEDIMPEDMDGTDRTGEISLNRVRRMPDERIKQQWTLAILNGDIATRTLLENMYEIGGANE